MAHTVHLLASIPENAAAGLSRGYYCCLPNGPPPLLVVQQRCQLRADKALRVGLDQFKPILVILFFLDNDTKWVRAGQTYTHLY